MKKAIFQPRNGHPYLSQFAELTFEQMHYTHALADILENTMSLISIALLTVKWAHRCLINDQRYDVVGIVATCRCIVKPVFLRQEQVAHDLNIFKTDKLSDSMNSNLNS